LALITSTDDYSASSRLARHRVGRTATTPRALHLGSGARRR